MVQGCSKILLPCRHNVKVALCVATDRSGLGVSHMVATSGGNPGGSAWRDVTHVSEVTCSFRCPLQIGRDFYLLYSFVIVNFVMLRICYPCLGYATSFIRARLYTHCFGNLPLVMDGLSEEILQGR